MTIQSPPPQAPPGWENAVTRLIRLEDEREGAVAWLAPGLGANCVAFAVRRTNGAWAQVLHAPDPQSLQARPTRYGCPILFPFPGYVRDARLEWGGAVYHLPMNAPAGPDHVHGFAHARSWHVRKVGPAHVDLSLSIADDLTREEWAAYPFDVSLDLSVQLTQGTLVAELAAFNHGAHAAPVGLGFHPYFDIRQIARERSEVRVQVPGGAERRYIGPYPTGERASVRSAEISLPPCGRDLLVARTDLGERPTCFVTGHEHDLAVCLRLAGAFKEFVLWVPADEQSVALEPTTSPLSAASQPSDHRDGIGGLEPGHELRASIALSCVSRGHS